MGVWPSGSSRRSPAQRTCSPPTSTLPCAGARTAWDTGMPSWYSTADTVKSDLFIQSDKNLSAAVEGVFTLLGHACDRCLLLRPCDDAAVSDRAGLVAPPGETKSRSRPARMQWNLDGQEARQVGHAARPHRQCRQDRYNTFRLYSSSSSSPPSLHWNLTCPQRPRHHV